jgi:hypothetical protein
MDSLPASSLHGDYADPVRRLLSVGESRSYDPAEWPDYSAQFGLGHEHVGDLIRLACDVALNEGGENDDDVWAPVHAWRALGQLRAEAAVAPLLALLTTLDADDTAIRELPLVFGMIGPAAMASIAGFLANRSNTETALASAMAGIAEIVARHPACRAEGVEILARMLEPHPQGDPSVSGFAVASLLDLKAVEAIDAIRAAFGRDAVEISIAGDLEDVEIDLGLRQRRATPAPRYHVLGTAGSMGPVRERDWSIVADDWSIVPAPRRVEKVGRNAACPCGSGKKYTKCSLK